MTTLRSFLLTCEPSTYDLITPANHRITVTVIPGILRRFRFTSSTMYTVDQVLLVHTTDTSQTLTSVLPGL